MSNSINTESEAAVPHAYDGYQFRATRGAAPEVEQFAGVIRNGPASPGEGDDYADARYYIDRATAQGGAKGAFSAKADSVPGLKEIVTATNLAEVTAGTHLLAPGTAVQVFSIYQRGSSGGKQYVFNLAPMAAVVVKITGTGGDGEYEGSILTGSASATDGGGLTMPMGMSPDGGNALILNVEEDALPGHRLKTASYAHGVVRGVIPGPPARSIVVIRGGVGQVDSPTTIGSDSDSSESAETTSWSKSSDATPVKIIVATRVVYNPTGDQTIYAFFRALTFDARGLLTAIGGETRMTVDVTESCP